MASPSMSLCALINQAVYPLQADHGLITDALAYELLAEYNPEAAKKS